MADHIVNLHYLPNPEPNGKPVFTAEPNPIFVKKGHSIKFQKSKESLPGTIRVTFPEPAIYSPDVTDGTKLVHVIGPPVAVKYKCELLDAKGMILAASEDGGDARPDPPPAP